MFLNIYIKQPTCKHFSLLKKFVLLNSEKYLYLLYDGKSTVPSK